MSATHYRWDDLPKEPLKDDLSRRLIAADRMMIAQVFLEKGCVVPQHSHENEQLTYIPVSYTHLTLPTTERV